MNQKYEKLNNLLKELFQLDQPDLDFGLYRVMHAKSAEVTQFLDKDLLPQVQAAFGQYKTADKAEIEKELAKVIAGIEAAGMDPAGSPKVNELRVRLKSDAVDVGALEGEVYDHLFSFFRRYYSDGDFLSKRVYKSGVYAIPYEGEEVKLHWANADQYYIKTSEYLRDYCFRLRPDDKKDPLRAHFRLVDAAEGEHGNVKAAEGKDRVFLLAAGGTTGTDFLALEDGEQGQELVLRFEYRPATLTDWPEAARKGKTKPPVQKDLTASAAHRVLAVDAAAFAPWIAALRSTLAPTEKDRTRTALEKHLDSYTKVNTFDYFIHKDLGGFLRRELDFYIKNEVMHLDDIENESVPRVEQYLSKIKVIRRIAGKVIDFLAQLEEFQKKLWLKKKFVVETSWCVRVGCIPEEFYAEIAANEAQREEWGRLFAIDSLPQDLERPSYSAPLSADFMQAHPTLVVDTRHFAGDFTARLLETVGDIDEQVDGVLVHSENFQALRLSQSRYGARVDGIFIDPPYNTGRGDFNYKDGYQHSTWLCMMDGVLCVARALMADASMLAATIDDGEQRTLAVLGCMVFGEANFIANAIWEKKYARQNDATHFSISHDHVLVYSRDAKHWAPSPLPRSAASAANYRNPDNDPRGPWQSVVYTCNKTADERPNLYYAVKHPQTEEEIWPDRSRVWAYEPGTHQRHVGEKRLHWGRGADPKPRLKVFLSELNEGVVPTSLWPRDEVGDNQDAVRLLQTLFGQVPFPTPKPTALIERAVRLAGNQFATTLDFFAGSGTTGHAVINLNREDGGRRKFILVEMGDYFDTVLLPRLKKVAFAPEWKDGKPKRLATPEEADRSPRVMKVVRLESYEDALNNLETRRTSAQQSLLDGVEAQGEDGLKEQYLLRYMLEVETRGSQSLLNVQAFQDPTAYRLKVKRPGSDESREVNVDLLETFNWLIGLTVQHIAAPQTFSAALEKDSEKRLRLKGRLRQDAEGLWWFRTVSGVTPDGRKTLVIWRKLTGDPERDNLVLDEWFGRQGYSSKDSEFDLIYVNGGNNLENLKAPDDTWKVRLIEEDFRRLMFETGSL